MITLLIRLIVNINWGVGDYIPINHFNEHENLHFYDK
jgi:hypothetical protein